MAGFQTPSTFLSFISSAFYAYLSCEKYMETDRRTLLKDVEFDVLLLNFLHEKKDPENIANNLNIIWTKTDLFLLFPFSFQPKKQIKTSNYDNNKIDYFNSYITKLKGAKIQRTLHLPPIQPLHPDYFSSLFQYNSVLMIRFNEIFILYLKI